MKCASRSHRARPLPLLGSLLVVLLAGCASAPPQNESRPAPTAGNNNGDVDQMAANALMLWGSNASANGSQALAQIRKAAEAAPQRADIQWLHLRICIEVPGCEPEPIELRLRKLDPGSGSVWLGPLARAQQRGETRVEEQILEAMGKSAHFNVYWTTLVARLTPPLSRSPIATSTPQPVPTPITNALNASIRWLSSLTTAAFRPLGVACDEKHTREPAIRVRCEQIAQALQKSDTTLAEGLGLGLAQRLAIPNSATSLQIQEKVDTLEHQTRASAAVVAAQVEKEKFSEQMLKLMAQLKKEQDVSRAIIRWAGQPLTP